MLRIMELQVWLVTIFWCLSVFGLLGNANAGEAVPTARGAVKVMFVFQEGNRESSDAVENALTRAFQSSGYSVLDAAVVAQALRRDADLLQLYEIEAAKRLGSRIGADIVVSGSTTVRAQDKTYSLLEGKRVTVSQANVGAKAILAASGKVLVAENAYARKPFDMTGEIALQTAAEGLATKLLEGIDRFLSRQTLDYRLVVFNVNHSQALEFQRALTHKVKGVRQVIEHSFAQNTLELEVSVDKGQDLFFKTAIFAQLSGLGLGTFEVVAREGESIYLQRRGRTALLEPQLPPVTPHSQPQDRQTTPQQPRRDPGSADEPSGRAQQTPAQFSTGYRKSWAVVIGINDYQHWPKLQYAVNDARSIEKALKRFGFDEVVTILDTEATQKRILRVLGDELYGKTDSEDRVFIFFAGHGQTQDLPNGSKMGYIIPVDGDLKHYYSSAISMHQLQDLADRIRAKHIFYAMDACFSGLLLRLRGSAANGHSVLDLTAVPTRQVLTAGTEGEQVVEFGGHGLFTKWLLDGLEGAADLNGDGYITASELYQFITPQVLEVSRNGQNPVFGRLGHGPGEFVFRRN